MKVFEVNYGNNYNTNKPDLLFCDVSRRLNDNNLFLSRFMLNTADILSEEFNVFWLVETKNGSCIEKIKDLYPNISFIYSQICELRFNKKDVENCLVKNNKIVLDYIKSQLSFLKNVKGIFFKPAILLSGPNGDNEFYDEVKDELITKDVLDRTNRVNIQIENKKNYTYTGYMTKFTRVMIDIFEYYHFNHGSQIYQFIIDPASYPKYFEYKCNAKTFYFENDNRGTRNLLQFPMGQLNYFYNYNIPTVDFQKKENNFIWGGLALFHKGERMSDYNKFLNNFRYDKSCLHISKTNSIKNSKKPKYSKILMEHPLFEQTKNDIFNHPLNLDLLDNLNFEKKLNNFKYSLILKCISKNDSLNFRIFYCLLFNVIPFIADNYDPDNIQIPEHFYEKLRVKNNKDIEDKITYFNNNKIETLNLLNSLKEYYMNKKYFEKEFYVEEFKNNYFKELFF